MKRVIVNTVGWCLLILSAYLVHHAIDGDQLVRGAVQLLHNGPLLLLMTVAYAAAFLLRSVAWAIQIGRGRVPVGRLWCYHHVGLLLNHLLPVKGGELARVALLRKDMGFSWGEALLSVGGNRLLDIFGLLGVAAVGIVLFAPAQTRAWIVQHGYVWLGVGIAAVVAAYLWSRYVRFRTFSVTAVILTTAGWMLEAAVVWSVVRALAGELGPGAALLVNSLTIIGQTFHVTPGGIGTYEAVMSGLLVQAGGQPLEFALNVAILSHGFKFLYSFLFGVYAAWRLSLSPLSFYRQATAEQRREKHEKSLNL
jgi:uncharacterized membrane protein YbhN (UPF0104 family)